MADSQEQQTPSKRIRGFLAVVLVGFAVWLALDKGSPFGLHEALELRSARVANAVLAPFYDDPGRNRYQVVLVDEPTLRGMGNESWPPPHEAISDLIDRLADSGADVVFLDLLFRSKGASPDALEAFGARGEATMARHPKLAIYSGVAGCDDSLQLNVSWFMRAAIVGKRPVTPEGDYQLGQCKGGAVTSPALTLFRKFCADHRSESVCQEPLEGEDLATLSLRWPVDGAGNTSWWSSIPTAIWNGFDELVAKEDDSEASGQVTAYNAVPTQSARDFLCGTKWLADCPHKDIDLRGKTVFVGTMLDGVNDFVESVRGHVAPGVYGHGVAYSNLLAYGPNYYHVVEGGWHGITWLDAVMLLAVFLFALLFAGAVPCLNLQQLLEEVVERVIKVLVRWKSPVTTWFAGQPFRAPTGLRRILKSQPSLLPNQSKRWPIATWGFWVGDGLIFVVLPMQVCLGIVLTFIGAIVLACLAIGMTSFWHVAPRSWIGGVLLVFFAKHLVEMIEILEVVEVVEEEKQDAGSHPTSGAQSTSESAHPSNAG